MSFKLLKKTASIITLITFIATNSIYAAPDSKSIFKNKKVDYQKISDQTGDVIQKKKAILNGDDANQSASQQQEAQRILSSHLSDISLIHLPPELGRIVEVYQGEGSRVKGEENEKLIVHIQDLHTNPEAEMNLAKILELLLNDYKMGLVCSEGAVGKLDTKELASFPDYAAREKVGRIFVNAGELTGEEYLAITKYPDIPIWGIETEDIYFKNIIDFNKIMKFNPGSQVFISQAKKALEELKARVYTKELLDLDQKEADYKAQKIETNYYVNYLLDSAPAALRSKNIALEYKNINLLKETFESEKKIDQMKVMNESQNLLLNLQSSLAAKSLRSDSDSLMAQAKLFQDQKISPFAFYSYLKDLAQRHLKDDFAVKYPNLSSFTNYLAKVNSIDSTDLFLELENLNFQIKQALSKTDEQKTLVKALRNINFLEGFFNLKVSNEELDYYINNRDSHKVAFFESFMRPALKKYNISVFVDYNASLIDPHLTELEEFYKVVKERDLAMVNNSLSEIEKRNSKVSTLIAGGFHTKGITKLLKEKGYSYIVVSPYSKTDMNEENYHFLLSGQRKPITELLNQLDLNEILNRFITTLRIPLASNTALIASFNEKVAPDIAKLTGLPAEAITLEPIMDRIGHALGLQRRASQWNALPFASIEFKVTGSTLVIRYAGSNGKEGYFKITGGKANGKPILSVAYKKDFDAEGKKVAEVITEGNTRRVTAVAGTAEPVAKPALPVVHALATAGALASNENAGSVDADLKRMHQYFRELEESAKAQGEENRFAVTLYIKGAEGEVAQEEVSIPLDKLDDNKDNLVKYLATLISIRGVLTGATEVGIETSQSSKLSADSLIKDIDAAVSRDFGKTQYFATFGKSIEFKRGRIQDGKIAVVQDQAARKVDYAKGDAIGFDIGGTYIKISIRRNGQVIFNDKIPLSIIDTTLGGFIKAKIKELDGEYGQGLAEKPIYVTIPGPVTPEGRIVDITNIEGSRKGTKGSLEELQSEMPNIKFQNDANVAAFYYMVETDLSDGNTIVNTLGTGLGLGIIINGRLTKGPQEAHVRIRFDKTANYHEGFRMHGDLESYASAEFVVRRAKELAGKDNILLPSGEITPKTVGEWLLNPEGDDLRTIATQVYTEFGNNLAVLYKEISRVTGIKNWKVVYVGGIAVGKTVETIIKGAQDALKETPDIKISFIALPEAPMAGSYGATYLGIQEQQMAGQSLEDLAKKIKSLVPEIGISDDRERLRKIFTDLKNSSNLEGLSILKAELETSKRAFGYAMDTGSGGNAYVFTLTDSFLKEVVSAILQEAVKGNTDAYLDIKNMNPLEAIAHFESGLAGTVANIPGDLFGRGFGYDIRGNALKIDGGIIDMTPENLYAIGKLLALKYTNPGDKYLVTGDIRMHTPILRYAVALGAASVGAEVDFSEEALSTGAHNTYSAENPKGYKVQVQMSGSHGVFQKNGAKIKADIGNGRLDPVYGEELEKLYGDRQQILAGAEVRNVQAVKIQEVSGIEDAIVDMYDKTLPKTVKDEILIVDTRAGGGGSLAAKLLAKRGYEVIDVDEVFGILGQAADMRALLSNQDNVARLLSLLNEKWDGGKHKIVFMLNMHPDPLMRRGIWDPSKPEAMAPTVTLVKAINSNLREGMPQAIGGAYDGDADRVGAVKENGEDIPAFEMTIPYYQRFLLDPQNKAAIIQMANAGIEPLWLALDVRANSKLQNTLVKISGILRDEYKEQYNKEYSGDMLNFVYINTGYPPQLAFIAWRIEEMKKFVDATPELSGDPIFMENFNHLIHTYYTAEASGHNFFHASPRNPERPCDCAIAAFISLINIKETMDNTEAPVLGIGKGSKTPLVALFETFPSTITSNEIRVVIPNSVKIGTAHKLGEWLKNQYGSELTGQKAEKIKRGDLEYEPVENGLVTVAGYKAQLKNGDSILIRWSNTGEQLTLLFEGHNIDSLINNVETVLNRMKEEQQSVPGLKLDDLEKELAGLKQKRDSSQVLASNQTFMQDSDDETARTERVSLASNANISRKQQVDDMEQIIAVPAENIIGHEAGFEKWIAGQPQNMAVVILAMPDEEQAVQRYKDIAWIKVVGKDISEEFKAKLTDLRVLYGKEEFFGGFKLGTVNTIDDYKAVAGSIASGV